jgi:hypothetical protein
VSDERKYYISLITIVTLLALCNTDITNRVIESGEFHKRKIQKTLSDAINIEVVSTEYNALFHLTILCTI